jgi:hypothetical protein
VQPNAETEEQTNSQMCHLYSSSTHDFGKGWRQIEWDQNSTKTAAKQVHNSRENEIFRDWF